MKKLMFILIVALVTVFSITACSVELENVESVASSSGRRSIQFASDVEIDSSTNKTSNTQSQVKSSNKEDKNSLVNSSVINSSTENSKNSISKNSSSKSNSSTKSSSSSSKSKSSSSSKSNSSSKSSSSSSKSTSSQKTTISSSVQSGNDTPSTKALVDVMVDASVSSNGTTVNGVKTYKTVTAALNAISGENKIIGIKKGTYKEKLTIPASLKNLTLIGDSTGETKLTYGDCSSMVGDSTDASASVTVLAEGFSAKNIHFENSYDYLGGSEKNKQALALYIKSDRSTFYSCTFSGH